METLIYLVITYIVVAFLIFFSTHGMADTRTKIKASFFWIFVFILLACRGIKQTVSDWRAK